MLAKDAVIRGLTNWIEARLTGKSAERESIKSFLLCLSPEERSGVWKLRTFYSRYNRGVRQKPTKAPNVRVNGPRLPEEANAWQQPR